MKRPNRRGTDSRELEKTMDGQQEQQPGEQQQEQEQQPQPEPPHATIVLRMANNGINLEVTNNVPTMTEAVHLANWIGLNLDALVLLARQDWHLRMEMNRLELAQQAGQLQAQAEGGDKPVIETGTPRLLAANGGPLQ